MTNTVFIKPDSNLIQPKLQNNISAVSRRKFIVDKIITRPKIGYKW